MFAPPFNSLNPALATLWDMEFSPFGGALRLGSVRCVPPTGGGTLGRREALRVPRRGVASGPGGGTTLLKGHYASKVARDRF